ncbi:unnamed protein product [Polarella glacialis]|uniref:Uncharacterized protein n=1 Tax=Polarella glacialis TaxID=89957 RepID=A0A813ILR6_POLGL|nr:unnamed protein product [Polarella glacialis]
MSKVKGNWLNRGNTQVLINHKLLADRLETQGFLGPGSCYNLFVFTRSDLLHLIPLPSSEELSFVLGPRDVLTQEGHEFGGVNYNFSVVRGAQLAREFLRGPYETIVNRTLPNRKKSYNIELFWRVLFGVRSWRNLRMVVTCFVTAETMEDRTTWKKVKQSADGGILFKYESQMTEAFSNLKIWQQHSEWRLLKPPLGLQVQEIHGQARRLFALAFASVVPERREGLEELSDEAVEPAADDPDPEGFVCQEAGDVEISEAAQSDEIVRFHLVPRKGWDRHLRGMKCSARNTINWKGRSAAPEPPQPGCWLVPASHSPCHGFLWAYIFYAVCC